MKKIAELLHSVPEYKDLLASLSHGSQSISVSGATPIMRAPMAAALYQDRQRPLVLVCADESELSQLQLDLMALLDEEIPLLSAREFSFHPSTASRQWEHRRLGIFHALLTQPVPILLSTIEALLQRTIPPEEFRAACRSIQLQKSYSLPDLADHLSRIGYSRSEQVEGTGQFSLRGGILDLFSPGYDQPVRAEFWGNEVDNMGFFDPVTQRRTQSISTFHILPAGEVIFTQPEDLFDAPDRALSRFYPKLSTASDYIPKEASVLFFESSRIADRANSWLWQVNEDVKSLLEDGTLSGKDLVFTRTPEQLYDSLDGRPFLWLDAFRASSYPRPPQTLLSLFVKQLPAFHLSLEAAADDLRRYRREHFRTVILTPSAHRVDQLHQLLQGLGIPASVDYKLEQLPGEADIILTVGNLSAGLEVPAASFAILAEGAPAPIRKKRRKASSNRQKLDSFSDLSPGDLVVHEHHGIGRFSGIVKMNVDDVEKDYVKLQFTGADVLYVPAMQLDLVSKYIGSGEHSDRRRLSKLGGTDWEKAKSRAKKAAKDLAHGLILLYAKRQREPGFAFSPDSPWQQDFEAQFEYEETENQLRCTHEIKRDMERPVPMDRLLCGDVGYGKTEVAFRAIMKCILDGKQAAILTPTTVLAQQHYLTAVKRFQEFPVKIEMISRFRTAAQSRAILQKAKEGSIDLLIGTHKLLQKNIVFKDLGLLVVDEEQRFGVSHKERLKELSQQVDVLILSATPIPRTLNMALSGLRDMSMLEEPPQNRQPVQTYVLEHDWSILSDAIRRELERQGQVYYLHNRIDSIESCSGRIRSMFPDARIAVAHGRMGQDALSEIMQDMRDNALDILICTTIIETGVDLPNVNTLIVEGADKMGLAQLHQLRGRVGRSARRAFAYMTFSKGKSLSEIAERRLSAIREFAAFGSGFKIAMRDLEIRGAGNLLGPEQSGFLMSVGYDMYLRLLEEAILEEQGNPPARPMECVADLSVPASIPDAYIPSSEQRMDIYRRIARIRDEEDARDMMDELIDRYGDPPLSANNLLSIALLRNKAAALGFSEIVQKESLIRFSFLTPDLARISTLCSLEKYKKRLVLSAGETAYLALRLKKGDQVLALAQQVINDFANLEGASPPEDLLS